MVKNRIADRVKLLYGESAFSIMAAANELEAQGRSVIHLEIGQPDFRTPRNISEAAYKAINDGHTGYTPTAGIAPLREAIAKYCAEYKNVEAEAENVVVVPGGKPTVFFSAQMLIQPGDEVIYPNPGFPTYESVIRFAGGKPVPMPLLEEKDFRVDIDRLKRDVNDRTKMVIINSPSNPTGGTFSADDIRAIADVVRGRGIYVLSDEIYDRIYFGEKPVSIASLPGMKDYTIILDGFSKTYSMTGWRLGYGVMNKELADYMTLLLVNSNSCNASMTQWAALEALKGPQDAVDEMVASFKERLDYIVAALNSIDGISCVKPSGAFYAFPNISSFGLSSDEFGNRLLREAGVAASPGTGFGEFGEGFIRISCANSLENLKIAVERIDKFVKTLR
ncbi:MAG: pyridoxal phosphate-dependent aminotransferase [Synergistaceae bacterium]|jgi:aspartate/methionine/tyrosine aminotransferase|nr:pyridoxal phosphate-dependent aminotransferase [Synergistaceae bacterium]